VEPAIRGGGGEAVVIASTRPPLQGRAVSRGIRAGYGARDAARREKRAHVLPPSSDKKEAQYCSADQAAVEVDTMAAPKS
jgi:hypothetical protein